MELGAFVGHVKPSIHRDDDNDWCTFEDEGEDDYNELKEEGMVDKSCVNLILNTHKHTMTLN